MPVQTLTWLPRGTQTKKSVRDRSQDGGQKPSKLMQQLDDMYTLQTEVLEAEKQRERNSLMAGTR